MGSGQWVVTTTCESVLTWNYDVSHQGLRDLYEKAKQEQWNVSVDVDWSPAVDPEAELLLDQKNPHVALIQDSVIWRKMTPQERAALRYETLALRPEPVLAWRAAGDVRRRSARSCGALDRCQTLRQYSSGR